MKFFKKGSLELSVNAIVIIILAIALLGLGLMFIRNFLGAGSEQLMKNMLNVEIQNPASSIEPITVSDINLQSGATKAVKVPIGFYCNSASACENAKPTLSCNGGAASNPPTSFDVAPKTTVTAHGSMSYIALIDAKESANDIDAGSYVCTVKVDKEGGAENWAQSKQITLTVA